MAPLTVLARSLVAGLVLVVGAAATGFAGLVVCGGLACTRRLRSGLPRKSKHSAIYVETFALWFALFLALQLGLGVLAVLLAPGSQLFVATIGFGMSLAALAWPVVRGVPWSQVREDIGLVGGRAPALEPFVAVGCYAMTLPILFVGLAITIGLMKLAELASGGGEPQGLPAHPIITGIDGDWWSIVQLYLVGCLAAPVVEEIAFRGLLYRHLRDLTRRFGGAMSVSSSTLVTAFIFAVIHPQGLLAVPALMAIAIGLTLAREWRGTLITSMTMHALNNGILMTALIVTLAA
jgi:hypothetical protein